MVRFAWSFRFIRFFSPKYRFFSIFLILCQFARLPFDWKNPLGYSLAIPIEFFGLYLANRYLACFLLFAFGEFLFALAFCKDMLNSLHTINENGKAKRAEPHIIKRKLIEFINIDLVLNKLRILLPGNNKFGQPVDCFNILFTSFQNNQPFFRSVSNNDCHSIFRQHSRNMHGSFTISNEHSFVVFLRY